MRVYLHNGKILYNKLIFQDVTRDKISLLFFLRYNDLLNLDDNTMRTNSYRINGTSIRQSRRVPIKITINHMSDKIDITSGNGKKKGD